MKCNRPHVGIAVIIKNDNGEVLMMKRNGSHGSHKWGFPGGKLEFFETFEDCAIRETKEETNIDVFDINVVDITNDFFHEDELHYVTIFVTGSALSYDAVIMEPNKFSDIGWFSKENLPSELFDPINNLKFDFLKF